MSKRSQRRRRRGELTVSHPRRAGLNSFFALLLDGTG